MSKKKWLWFIIAVNLVLILGAAIGVYGYGVSKYKLRFFRGTHINGLDCSDMEPSAVCSVLDSQIEGYSLEVMGRDPGHPENATVLGVITPEDVSLRRKDTAALVAEIFSQQNPYYWFEMFWKDGNDYRFEQEIEFESNLLEAVLNGWEACAGEEIIDPQDAYVSEYKQEENAYQVIPDTRGSRMDCAKALPAIEQALYELEYQVDIEDTGCYKDAQVRLDDKRLNDLVNQVNSWLGTNITYDWYGTELTVGQEELSEWVRLENEEPVLDEEAVRKFIKNAKKEYDPKGHTYSFQTSLGVEVKLKCKSGWVTDEEKEGEELIRLIKEGAQEIGRQPASSTENYVFFDGTVGNSYAEVDLSNQHLYFYYQGELVLETDFVSGDVESGHATPEGIFAVTFKERDRILRGPDYESFVHYWMPFYGGYGMHDAMWRRVFGGSIYLNNGSHGCVNLPLKNAEKIYGYVEKGFPVVCYYYAAGKNPKDQLIPASGQVTTGGEGQGQTEGTPQAAGGEGQGQTEENPQTSEGEGESREDGLNEPVEENEIRGQW